MLKRSKMTVAQLESLRAYKRRNLNLKYNKWMQAFMDRREFPAIAGIVRFSPTYEMFMHIEPDGSRHT